MKIRKWIAAAVLLALGAGAALAQVVANDGSSTRQQTSGMAVGGFVRADTTLKVLTMDASGNLKTVDADRDRDKFAVSSIQDTVRSGLALTHAAFAIAQWSAESTAVIQTYNYSRFSLGLRAIPVAGDTTTDIQIAVQIRGHSSATFDTSSTFVWHQWAVASPVSQANIDSIGHFDNIGYNGANGYSSPFSGEFVVNLSPKRGYGHMGYGQAFGGPSGVLVSLVGPRGEAYWAPYTSVRIRLLRGQAGTNIKATLMMGS